MTATQIAKKMTRLIIAADKAAGAHSRARGARCDKGSRIQSSREATAGAKARDKDYEMSAFAREHGINVRQFIAEHDIEINAMTWYRPHTIGA